MPETSSYEQIFGSDTSEPTPVQQATAAPQPNPTPNSSSYEQIFGTKPQSGVDQILSPLASKNPVKTQISQTVDDRTLIQRYWTGTVRQATAGLLDAAVGIPFAGATWLAAGMKAVARGVDPKEAGPLFQMAENINRGVGEGMQLIDTVAGRPVIEIPESINVPVLGGAYNVTVGKLFGNQDLFRLVAGFAPLPVVAGERLAAAGGEAAVKAFGKAFAFQLGIAEARPGYELASAQTSDERSAALQDALKTVGSSAALTGLFFGVGALKGKIQQARAEYAVEQSKNPEAIKRAMSAAIAKDSNEAGSTIGDPVARVNAELALRRQALEATILKPEEQLVYHGSGNVFDQFDASKIGTGQGAASYLEGLYFAEHPGTAISYKKMLAPGGGYEPRDMAARVLEATKGNEAKAIAELESRRQQSEAMSKGLQADYEQMPDSVQQITTPPVESHANFSKNIDEAIQHIKNGTAEGQLYRVGLKKEAVKGMLDWDAEAIDEPKAVDAIRGLILKTAGDNGPRRQTMMMALDRVIESPTGGGESGSARARVGEVIQYMRDRFGTAYGLSNKSITKAMADAGYTGVKYFDQLSRGEGKGTRNYVVFSDKAVRIIRPIEGAPRGETVGQFADRQPGEFIFGDKVQLKSDPGVDYNVEKIVEPAIPGNLKNTAKYQISRTLPDGSVETLQRYGLEMRDMGPRYDPEVGAKALRLPDGTVLMSNDMTHNAVSIEAIQRGLISRDTKLAPEDYGRIWGPEKRYFTEEEYAKGRLMQAERDAALAEVELLERTDRVASDTAAQAEAPGTGNEPPGAGYPGSPDTEKLTATQRHLQHAMQGGGSFDFDVNTLPNVNPNWKHFGALKSLYENVVLKPFNPLLTPEQQSQLRITIGTYEKILHDGINRAAQVRNQLEEIFPYLTREQRLSKAVANVGYQAQIAAGTMETKYTIGDKVTQFGDDKPWRVTGKTEDGRYTLERNNQKKTVPETALEAYGMLQRDAARAGFTWDQNLALEQGLREILNRVHAEATAAGALKPGQYLKDYFVRSFKPPPNWNEERIQGFLKTFLSADAAKNEHALHRLFRLHEQALDAGFTYKTNHIGTLMYNYMVSMAESTARSLARSGSAKQLQELGLLSRQQPNKNWVRVAETDAPEFEGRWIPKDAFRMVRPIFEIRGGLDMIDKFDKWNHIAKRFGLGLDFYNSMNILRGTISTGQNPFTLGKFVDYYETEHPEVAARLAEIGLRVGLPTDYVARDQALERDYRLSGDEDWRNSIREGKYGEAAKRMLLQGRHVFYWVEENLVQNMLETAKKAAFYKEFNKAEAFEMDRIKGDLSPGARTHLMQKVAYDVNQRFGGINLDQMGRSKMARVGLRMLLLSPDWTESRLRLYADSLHEGTSAFMAPIRAAFGDFKALDALKPQNTANLRSSIRLFAATLAATELANLAINGTSTDKNDNGNRFYVQLPFETKYGTHPSVNLWGYQEMPLRLMYHVMNAQPELWFNERQAPAWNAVSTWAFSQDNFGEKLKGDLPFMRPPVSQRELNQRVLLQKSMLTAGQLIPSIFTDTFAAVDRSMKDGAIDGVRATRAIANFTAIKISSNYPQDLRREIDFFENNATMTRSEIKRRFQMGKWQEAMDLKREWNDRVTALQRMIRDDPSARAAFRRRSETISSFKIR